MKFKSVVMNLDESFKPKKPSWSMMLLKVFMPHLVDWSTKSRLEKIIEFQDFIIEIESALNANESNDSRNEYVANDSECNEFVQNDVKDEECQFYESKDSN